MSGENLPMGKTFEVCCHAGDSTAENIIARWVLHLPNIVLIEN
jgi:hypothetical protein